MFAGMLEAIGTTAAHAAFWTGLVVVNTFALNRFWDTGRAHLALTPPLPIRTFTTRIQYFICLTAYAGIYSFLYITLIAVGAVPEFQSYISQFVGSLGSNAADIATPAGAALVTTTLTSATPALRRLDNQLITVLCAFTAIPQKARALANDVLAGLTASSLVHSGRDRVDDWEGVFDRLENAIDTLANSGSGAFGTDNYRWDSRKYKQFFAGAADIRADIRKQFDASAQRIRLLGEVDDDEIDRELGSSAFELSVLLACSALRCESREGNARALFRQQFFPDVGAVEEWHFSVSQALLGMLVVVAVLAVGAFLSQLVTLYQINNTSPLELWAEVMSGQGSANLTLSMQLWWLSFKFGIAAVPMFVLPLFLAAGAQMFLLDRKNYQLSIGQSERTCLLIVLSALFFVLAVFPSFLYTSLTSGSDKQPYPVATFVQLSPWAVSATVFALTFVLLARRQAGRNGWTRFGIEFAIFTAVCWLATFVASKIALAMIFSMFPSQESQRVLFILQSQYESHFPIIIALVAGLVGAMQSRFSRAETADDTLPELETLKVPG